MKVETFETYEEMFESLQKQREQARKQTENLGSFLEKFREPGTCFVQVHPAGFWIYGKVEGSEYEEDQEMLEASFRDGYIFCRAASELCPEGELGSIHISQINAVISPLLYESAKQKGWPSHPWVEFREGILQYNPNMGFH
jgi:hypothetical protein